MANGKWIPGLASEMPLPEAARQVFEVRLGAVRDFLPQALHRSDEDPEHVHQLRVSTRRARAALRIFAACLPGKVHDGLRKVLRRIRCAAGDARDADVFLDMLGRQSTRATARHKPGLDFLTGHTFALRAEAQQRLTEALGELGPQLDKAAGAVSAALNRSRKKGPVLRDLAEPLLRQLLEVFEEAARQDLEEYDQLHRVRIAGKNLRYAMEVFESCYPSQLREVGYPAVEEMQEILGEANDSYVASIRLRAILKRLCSRDSAASKRVVPGIQALLEYHQARMLRQRQQFLHWWKRWHAGPARFVENDS